MHLRLQALLSVALLALSAPLWAAKRVDLDYLVRFLPATDDADRRLVVPGSEGPVGPRGAGAVQGGPG